MKKCTLFVTLWLFMCVAVMAQFSIHSSQLTQQQLYANWVSQGKPINQTPNKMIQARTIPLNFDFMLINHSLPSTSIPIDTYAVLFESDEYSGVVQFYKTPTASEFIPAGTYKVAGDYKESTVLQGFQFAGLTLGSYFNKIENGKVVEQYLFSSGQLSVVIDADNANHITINGSVMDSQGNTLEISADHIITDADKYYAEPETNVHLNHALNRLQCSVDSKTKMLNCVMMNDTIAVNLAMYRDAQASDDAIDFGVFQLNNTGNANTFSASNGYNVMGQLSPCYVSVSGSKYPLVSGTVTITEKQDQSGFDIAVDVLSYKGSHFEFTSEFLYADNAFQLEGSKVTQTLNITKYEDQCLSKDRTLALDTFAVNFTSSDYIMMLRVAANHSNSNVLPNGDYQVASVLGNGAIKESAGASENQNDLFSIVLGDFNILGKPQSVYFIRGGNMTKEDDPNHDGEFIYTFHLTTYYGSTFESTFNTYIEPYGPEASQTIAITEDWNYVEYSHKIADASKGEALDSYELLLKNADSGNEAKLVLYADLASPKTLEAGRYDLSSVKEQGKIAAGSVDPTDRTKILPSYITYNDAVYFITTGSCTVSYPDASDEYHINLVLSVTSAKGSTFDISIDYTMDPYEGYTYNYESTTVSHIVFNPKKVETTYSSEKKCYTVELTNDTLRCNLEAFVGNADLSSLPAGEYAVADTKGDNTIFKSPGISPQGVVGGSYFGKINEKGQLLTVYYIVGGKLTVADSPQGKLYTLDFNTFHTSTITGAITVGTGVESISQTSIKVSAINHNLVVENAYGNLEVFNTMGQKVFEKANCNGNVTICNLPINAVYIVKCNKDMVKLFL